MRDTLLTVTKALPAAAATATSDTLDLGPNGGNHAGDNAQLEISCPATPALVDAKTIIFTVRDSADDSTYADVVGYGNMIMTGAGGVGSAAFATLLKLHNHVRRYVQITAAVLTGGGSNIAVSFTAAVRYP